MFFITYINQYWLEAALVSLKAQQTKNVLISSADAGDIQEMRMRSDVRKRRGAAVFLECTAIILGKFQRSSVIFTWRCDTGFFSCFFCRAAELHRNLTSGMQLSMLRQWLAAEIVAAMLPIVLEMLRCWRWCTDHSIIVVTKVVMYQRINFSWVS